MTNEEHPKSDPSVTPQTSKRDYLRLLLALAGVGALSTTATEPAKAAHLSSAPFPSGAWGYSPIAGHGVSNRPSITTVDDAWSETYHHLFQDIDVGSRWYAEKNDTGWDLLPIVWDGLDTPADSDVPAAGTMVEQDEGQSAFRLLGIDDDGSHYREATVAWTETAFDQTTTLTWTTTADWDAAQSETGVHHEQPTGTDWAAADVLEKGYPTFDQNGNSLNNYWPNDDNTGTTSSDVAGSDDGTINGATWQTGGILNTPYLSFDGTDDYVDVGSMGTFGSSLPPFSASFWIRTTTTDVEAVFGTFNDGTNTGIQCRINTDAAGNNDNGKIQFFIRDDDNHFDRYGTTNATTVNDGDWHHIIVAYDQATSPETQLYFDGSSVAMTQGNTDVVDNVADFQYTMTYGARNVRGSIDQHFTGDLDEPRFSTRKLDSTDASELYNAIVGGSDYWTSKKTATANQTNITVTTNSSIPSGASIDVTLFEDVGNDDTGAGTDALGNNYDNTDTANLTSGNNQSANLTGFDDSGATSAYWFHIEPDITNNDPTTDAPTLSEISIDA